MKRLSSDGDLRGTPRRPFIKWAGGKTRLLRHLLPHVPSTIQDFHEPFLGGGAMFFAVSERTTGSACLADLSEELVNAWQVVAELGDELAAHLKPYLEQDCERFYYSLRPCTPEARIDRACRFLYLNQTSWNGLWRVNKWGEFNVPWGQRPFRGFSPEDLDSIACALQGVSIGLRDFRDSLETVGPGDFVYLDPPYLPLSDTSKFFFYTEKRFREADLRDLAACCSHLTEIGATWLLSNRDTPLVRELFADAKIIGLTTRRSVAAPNWRDVEGGGLPRGHHQRRSELTALPVAALFLWRLDEDTPFKAVYGRVSGSTTYTKDYLQLRRNECAALLDRVMGRQEGTPLPISYRWPGGSATGELRSATDHDPSAGNIRLQLAWPTDSSPAPWRLGDPTTDPVVTVPGTPGPARGEGAVDWRLRARSAEGIECEAVDHGHQAPRP